MPGTMVGSIDGWLGFLGGYSGGFLAFISAYIIYRHDQKQKERTTLLVRTTSQEYSPSDVSLIYTTLPDTQVEADLRGKLTFEYRIFNMALKNVSSNFTAHSQLTLIHSNKAKIEPWTYNKQINRNIKYESIATLEANESRVFNIQIEEALLQGIEFLDFELMSRNMFGQCIVQSVRMYLHYEMKGYTFTHRT
jgi:hypothetical protein